MAACGADGAASPRTDDASPATASTAAADEASVGSTAPPSTSVSASTTTDPPPSNPQQLLEVAAYFLSCGKVFGHGGALSGTTSIALVSEDARTKAVVAVNLRRAEDADLLGFAERMLCAADAP